MTVRRGRSSRSGTRWWLVLAVTLLATTLAPYSSAARAAEEGWVNFPTGVAVLPGIQGIICQGCTVWKLDPSMIEGNGGRPFALAAGDAFLPGDLDVYFYSDTLGVDLLASYANPGDEAGQIPSGTSRGFVVMNYGAIVEFQFRVF